MCILVGIRESESEKTDNFHHMTICFLSPSREKRESHEKKRRMDRGVFYFRCGKKSPSILPFSGFYFVGKLFTHRKTMNKQNDT